MSGRRPDEPVGFAVVRQDWRQVAFLHWPVDPAVIEAMLPKGLEPDVLQGTAWVGLTPFHVERSGGLGVVGPARVTAFAETNLRTYVRGPGGRDGIWFLSLDVSGVLTAAGGRAIGAPYYPATMAVDRQDAGAVTYTARRRLGPSAEHDLAVVPGPACEPDDLVTSLTGRWRAFTAPFGRLVEVRVAHEPWPLHTATVARTDQTLTQAAGLDVPADPPLVHWSPGVDARLAAPRRGRRARGHGLRGGRGPRGRSPS